jgi:hypothetical protein
MTPSGIIGLCSCVLSFGIRCAMISLREILVVVQLRLLGHSRLMGLHI